MENKSAPVPRFMTARTFQLAPVRLVCRLANRGESTNATVNTTTCGCLWLRCCSVTFVQRSKEFLLPIKKEELQQGFWPVHPLPYPLVWALRHLPPLSHHRLEPASWFPLDESVCCPANLLCLIGKVSGLWLGTTVSQYCWIWWPGNGVGSLCQYHFLQAKHKEATVKRRDPY